MSKISKRFTAIVSVMFFTCLLTGFSLTMARAKVLPTSKSTSMKAAEVSGDKVIVSANSDNVSDKPSVLFIMGKSMVNSKLAEFYNLLQSKENDINVYSCYTDDLSELTDNADVKSKIALASQIFIVGVPFDTNRTISSEAWLKYPAIDKLRKSSNSAKWYYVYTLNSTSNFNWFNLSCNHTEMNLISSSSPWIMMYSGLFDKTKDMGLKKNNEKPTRIAGYGLAVYMQFVLNKNTCMEQSYSDLLVKMNITGNSASEVEKCETARKYITKELSYRKKSFDTKTVDVQMNVTVTADNLYKETKYEVFYDMYYDSGGIWSLNHEADGNPICFDGGYGGKFIERVWDKDKWIHNDYSISQNEADYGGRIHIDRDSSGNYYIGKFENGGYYIYKYNAKCILIKKVCINNLTRSSCSKFYIYKKDQLLIQTYLPADLYSADDKSYSPVCYDQLILVNMKTGKIIRKFDTGCNFGEIEISKDKIYLINKDRDRLLIINGNNGKIEKVMNLENFVIHKDGDSDYYISVYKNNIYFLDKKGIYKLYTKDGSWSEIIGGDKYYLFKYDDLKGYGLVVKNDKEIYVLAGWSEEECCTIFLKYTRK